MHSYYWFAPVIAVTGLFILILTFYFIFRGRRSSDTHYTWYGWYRTRPCSPNVVVVDQGYVTSVTPQPVIVANRDTVQAATDIANEEARRNPGSPPPQVVVVNKT
jgi:hypothetical protein